MQYLRALLFLFGSFIAPSIAPAAAQISGNRELVIATKEAAPFAMKAADGSWFGISIDLWRRVGDQLQLRYRFVEEPTVPGLLHGTAEGKYDAAVAALTITAERERMLDFSQPFYLSGLGIAVPSARPSAWQLIIDTVGSFGFVQAILALVGLAVGIGLLIWLFERRHNEDFGGGAVKGLGTSIWWSAETMTQASTGYLAPRTLPGRILAIVWMAASVVALAVFTASVTSTLTTRKLQGLVSGVNDLTAVRVGVVVGSATTAFLDERRIGYQTFATPQDGLGALKGGTLDAFVYDKPLLAWIVREQFASSAEILEISFDAQMYGIALPPGSPLREPVDVAMLETIQGAWWRQTLFRYLGER
ncbi:transporter substrate-binding domain-containing protein [Microvirga yunnanensis]|uniref:transporter substrate-binding domain-containing protein n=1 Tax=Microvirga yunnanensis TaxID=2953740 RepID=UPI0021C85B36|nr:transporter substrate-binding domain-containing protein [Microvirga sp. HBU65207]